MIIRARISAGRDVGGQGRLGGEEERVDQIQNFRVIASVLTRDRIVFMYT